MTRKTFSGGPAIPKPDRQLSAGRFAWAASAALLAASATLVLLLDRWLTAQLDDPRAALLVSTLMIIGFVSFLSVAGQVHGRHRS